MPLKAIQNLPTHAKEIYESTAEGLRGKTNPRTGKPFTDAERNMIAWNAVKQKYKKVNGKWIKKMKEIMKECPEGQEWDSVQKKCIPCPSGKIRSGGKGRGEGHGKGKDPIGIPIGKKLSQDSGWEELA